MNQEYVIRRIAYERFKLLWMIQHGYSLEALARRLQSQLEAENSIDPITDPLDISVEGLFHEWEHEVGFDGMIWPCYEEFIANEYLDASQMSLLFDGDEITAYVSDRCKLVRYEVHLYQNGQLATVDAFDDSVSAYDFYTKQIGGKALIETDLDGNPLDEIESTY